jgi:drug/metabolite transporter (DMT)-like permease
MTENSLPRNNPMPPLTILFTVFLCGLFGANAVAIKIAMAGIGPLTMAAMRFTMAAVAISLWAHFTGRSRPLQPGQWRHLVLIAVLFTAQLTLFYLGLSKTHASRGTLLANLQPFFTLFLAHFFIANDRITARKMIGLALGFSGVACVYWEQHGGGGQLRLGDLLITCAAFLWAANGVYVKRVIDSFQPHQVILYPMFIAVPCFLAMGIILDDGLIFNFTLTVGLALLYQGLVTAAFAFVAWNTLLQRYGAVALHSFIFIMPVSGVILGGALLDEPITAKILMALLLICLGLLVIHLHTKKPAAPILLYRG